MDTIDRIFMLIKQTNTTPNKVATSCGLQNNSFTKWKNKMQRPNIDALIKIADYFNVSLDYLVGRETPTMITNQSTPDTMPDATTATLLNACRQLNKLQQQKVLTYINDIAGVNNAKNSPVMMAIREAEVAGKELATKEVRMQQEKKDV